MAVHTGGSVLEFTVGFLTTVTLYNITLIYHLHISFRYRHIPKANQKNLTQFSPSETTITNLAPYSIRYFVACLKTSFSIFE